MNSDLREPHPDELALDELRAGAADPALEDHVAACESCREQMKLMDSLASELGPPALPIDVPVTLDAAILAMADRRARQIVGVRRTWMRIVVPVVAAAAAAVLFVLLRSGPTASAKLEPADINADGQVDILDAFSLARTIEASDDTRPEWDFTGDGVVNESDVDWVARTAVSVKGNRL